MEKKIKQIELGYDKRVRDLKPYLFDMARDFVQEQARNVTATLTKQHHHIVDQFKKFKERSYNEI